MLARGGWSPSLNPVASWEPRSQSVSPVLSTLWLHLVGVKKTSPSFAGEEPGFHLDVQDPIELVSALAEAFVGGDLMIEGSLKSLHVGDLPVSSTPPSGLKRHTAWSWPKQQVIVIPLMPELLPEIRKRVIGRKQIGSQRSSMSRSRKKDG